MLAISGGRGSGKTEKLIEWYRNTPGAVIVTIHEAERVRLNREYGIPLEDIITFQSRDGLRNRRPTSYRLGIDNLDHLLSYFFGSVPDVITFTE